MGTGVTRTFSGLVKFKALDQIIRVSRIVTPILALEDIDMEGTAFSEISFFRHGPILFKGTVIHLIRIGKQFRSVKFDKSTKRTARKASS